MVAVAPLILKVAIHMLFEASMGTDQDGDHMVNVGEIWGCQLWRQLIEQIRSHLVNRLCSESCRYLSICFTEKRRNIAARTVICLVRIGVLFALSKFAINYLIFEFTVQTCDGHLFLDWYIGGDLQRSIAILLSSSKYLLIFWDLCFFRLNFYELRSLVRSWSLSPWCVCRRRRNTNDMFAADTNNPRGDR